MKNILRALWFILKFSLMWLWAGFGMAAIGLAAIGLVFGCLFSLKWLAEDCGIIGKILVLPAAIGEIVGIVYLVKFIFKGWRPWNDNRHEGFGPW